MKAGVKEKWVNALRSGRFKQTRGSLRYAEGFCCLGVLCELAAEEGVVLPAVEVGGGVYGYLESQDGTPFTAFLPDAVANWAGINRTGYIQGDDYEVHLTQINDGGSSFSEIADLIEQVA